MTSQPQTELLTIGDIARNADVPIHKVEYFLRSRPHIQPAARAGRYRLFTKEQLSEMLPLIARMRRGKRPPRTMSDGETK